MQKRSHQFPYFSLVARFNSTTQAVSVCCLGWRPSKACACACRQMFANAQLARMAAEKELEEAQGRTTAQHALANARAQAAQRALVVAKEKASNEAKSEFMSLMCHEVSHPSAEPPLQSTLKTGSHGCCHAFRHASQG